MELRELDTAIARRQGWTDVRATGSKGQHLTGILPDNSGRTYVPRFSSDPAAAMGLLKETLKRGWWVTCLDEENCILRREGDMSRPTGVGKTLEEAIARACLAAYEREANSA